MKKIFVLLGLLLFLEGIALFSVFLMKPETATADESGKRPGATKTAGYPAGGKRSTRALDIWERNEDVLVLVNGERALDSSYKASLRKICNGRLRAAKVMYRPLVRMLKDAGKEGYHFWIASAWRSREKQQKLVDEDVRREMGRGVSYKEARRRTLLETMPPGHSEHETGLALDILCSENMNMDSSQARMPGNQWLKKNCHRYGFILRYPKNKEKITGIHYEPWHFRYVGEEASRYMKKHGLTLEEFWERLENN